MTFDDASLTLLDSDWELVIVDRGEIATVKVAAEPKVPAEPTVAAEPAGEATQDRPAAERAPDVSDAQAEVTANLLTQNALPADCMNDRSSSLCKAQLRAGADELDRRAAHARTEGLTALGISLVLMPFGLWLTISGVKVAEIERACASVLGPDTATCDKGSETRIGLGSVLLIGAGVGLIAGFIILPNAYQREAGARVRRTHNLALRPAFSPSLAGAVMSGSF